jgi:hypothetical protein
MGNGAMSYVDSIVAFAAGEEGKSWKTDEAQILEYFRASTGNGFTKAQAKTLSWCTFFVMWVLKKSEVDPLPMVGQTPPENFSTARFIKSLDGRNGATNKVGSHSYWGVYPAFSLASKMYQPKAGDLFYLPAADNHIGIIEEVLGDGNILTLNGNSGPAKDEGFDPRRETGIGGGFVFRKSRNLLDKRPKHAGACWIQIPD